MLRPQTPMSLKDKTLHDTVISSLFEVHISTYCSWGVIQCRDPLNERIDNSMTNDFPSSPLTHRCFTTFVPVKSQFTGAYTYKDTPEHPSYRAHCLYVEKKSTSKLSLFEASRQINYHLYNLKITYFFSNCLVTPIGTSVPFLPLFSIVS